MQIATYKNFTLLAWSLPSCCFLRQETTGHSELGQEGLNGFTGGRLYSSLATGQSELGKVHKIVLTCFKLKLQL